MHAEVSFRIPPPHTHTPSLLGFPLGWLWWSFMSWPCGENKQWISGTFFWIRNDFLTPLFGGPMLMSRVVLHANRAVVFPPVFDQTFFAFFPGRWVSMSWPIWADCNGNSSWMSSPAGPSPILHWLSETPRSLDRKAPTDVKCKTRQVFKPLKLWEGKYGLARCLSSLLKLLKSDSLRKVMELYFSHVEMLFRNWLRYVLL